MQSGQGDPMEMMIDMMVAQAKMQDELFLTTETEHEDFECSLMYFMQTDKEVQQAM